MADVDIQNDEQITRLDATVMAMQDMAIRFQQLAAAATQQLQELKSGKPAQPKKKTTDWSKWVDF